MRVASNRAVAIIASKRRIALQNLLRSDGEHGMKIEKQKLSTSHLLFIIKIR